MNHLKEVKNLRRGKFKISLENNHIPWKLRKIINDTKTRSRRVFPNTLQAASIILINRSNTNEDIHRGNCTVN